MPERVQLRRTKGWRMPANTVKVDRSNKVFGNPFTADSAREAGYLEHQPDPRAFLARCFREWLFDPYRWWQGLEADQRKRAIFDGLDKLRGKNLACWCPLDGPCHADVLLELANRPASASAQPEPKGGET